MSPSATDRGKGAGARGAAGRGGRQPREARGTGQAGAGPRGQRASGVPERPDGQASGQQGQTAERRGWQCCGDHHPSWIDYIAHVKAHHPERIRACRICGVEMTRQVLSSHQRLYHTDEDPAYEKFYRIVKALGFDARYFTVEEVARAGRVTRARAREMLQRLTARGVVAEAGPEGAGRPLWFVPGRMKAR